MSRANAPHDIHPGTNVCIVCGETRDWIEDQGLPHTIHSHDFTAGACPCGDTATDAAYWVLHRAWLDTRADRDRATVARDIEAIEDADAAHQVACLKLAAHVAHNGVPNTTAARAA